MSLAQCREQIAAARSAVSALGSVLWQAPSGGGPDGLSGLLGEVDALGMACDAARVAVVGEAMDRGETSGGSAAMTVTQWVRHHAPSTRAGGAGQVVAVAQAFGKTGQRPGEGGRRGGPVAGGARRRRWSRSTTGCGRCSGTDAGTRPDHADRPGRRRRAARLPEGPPVHPGPVRAEGVLQEQQDRGQGVHLALPAPGHRGGHLRVPAHPRRRGQEHPRGRARAAVGAETRRRRTGPAHLGPAPRGRPARPWSAGPWRPGRRSARPTRPPCCSPWTGSPCATGSAPATTLGGLDAGTHLAPETVRRLCCDASVIPVVLGSNSEVLDWGLERRSSPRPRPSGCGCATAAAPTPAATPRRSGPTPTTWSTGPTSDPPTWPTPPCSATGTTPSCTTAATPAASSATARGTGRVGPHPRLLRRTARPARRPGTSVTPPHTPPPAGGARGMSRAGIAQTLGGVRACTGHPRQARRVGSAPHPRLSVGRT